MKTNIRKIPAVLLLAVLCLAVFPFSTFAAQDVKVRIPVTIQTSGETPSPEENYTVVLQAVDDAPMPSENVLEITGAGQSAFPVIQYTTPGVYCYTVTQKSGTHERAQYDQTVYYVKVSVTNGENGNLETVIAAHTDQEMTDAKRDITFTNYYKPKKKTSESTTEIISTIKTKPETKPGKKENAGKKSKNKVKTGDNTNTTLFAILLFVSGTGLLIIAISCYREKYHR